MYSFNKANHLRDQIDEIKVKLSLKRRDNDNLFQKQAELVKKNEEKILEMRMEVKESRMQLAATLNSDQAVIQKALKDKEKPRMVQAYGRLDFRSAKTNLQGGISLLKKKYSHVSHQKECRMRRLQDLKLKYRDTQLLEHANFENRDQQMLRVLSTKLDKMILKRNTASFINQTYKKTLTKLDRDALFIPNSIDDFEKLVKETGIELEDLKKIHEVAKAGQEVSRARRISTEKIFYTGKQERDRTLTELRKKVKANSEMPDVDVKRTYQDLKDSAAHSKVKLSDMPSMKLAEMEPMIKMFSSLTNTSTAEEIPTAYKRQIQNHKQLVEISEKMKVKLDQALEKHDQLEKNLEDQRYHQTQQTLEAEQKLKNIEDDIESANDSTEAKSESGQALQNLVKLVDEGMASLAAKISSADGAFDKEFATLSIQEKVKKIVEELQKMKKLVDDPSIGSCSLEDNETEDDPMERLLQLQSKKCRITVGGGEEDGAADGYLIDDSIANENFRSYEEIKTGAQKNRRGRKR